MDDNRDEVLALCRDCYEPDDAGRWFNRWRLFSLAWAELWGFRRGQEWLVSHYISRKRG
jgi:cyclopropane-fatty-acyl-phospholipid synthase